MPLQPGVQGYAVFAGDRDQHRIRLDRVRGTPVFGQPFALFIGMNPSRAEADQDDLTVRKEQEWTWRMGLFHYVKMNVGSWRCTDPKQLDKPGVCPVHPDNLPAIRDLAGYAETLVLSTGAPPGVLIGPARTLFRALTSDRRVMRCFGTVKGGWPRHTSRLAYDTPLVDFRP